MSYIRLLNLLIIYIIQKQNIRFLFQQKQKTEHICPQAFSMISLLDDQVKYYVLKNDDGTDLLFIQINYNNYTEFFKNLLSIQTMQANKSIARQQFDDLRQKNQISTCLSPNSLTYLNQITPIDKNSQEFKEILSKLKQNGFEYNQQFSFQFSKNIIKSSRDSIKYQIQYGNFKIYLYVSFVSYDFSKIQRNLIGQGKFGKIFSFDYEKQSIAAKYFKFRDQPIDHILRQLFWMKLASILKIGPIFLRLYGYDLICFQDHCECLMEQCQKNIKEIQLKDKITRMKGIIRILHSLNAVHGDIKLSHFFWSSKQQNAVVLDFGMTRFIKQKIGLMTQTLYFGTFSYSSQQMKKAFFVKMPIPVDLYYNDLYGIKKCEQYLNQEQSLEKAGPHIENNQSKWQLVINLFKFKFNIFERNFSELIKLHETYHELSFCFRHIVLNQQKYTVKCMRQWDCVLSKLQSNYAHNYAKSQIPSESQIIYTSIIECHRKPPILYKQRITKKFIKKMFEKNCLQTYLKYKQSMEALFDYFFDQKQLVKQEGIERKQVLKYIFNIFYPYSQYQTLPRMVRSVLVKFQNHFYHQGNLQKLLKIRDIFKLTFEIKYLKKINNAICQVFLKNISLWLDQYKKGIVGLIITIQKNPRLSWEWLTTQIQIRKKFLNQKDHEAINSYIQAIQEIDFKIASNYINLNQDSQKIVQNCKLQFVLQKEDIAVLYDRLKRKPSFLRHKNNQNKDLLQTYLVQGIAFYKFENQFAKFVPIVHSLGFILRKTIWHLILYLKINNIDAFQQCLEEVFSDVFIPDILEGIYALILFSSIFLQAMKKSNKVKQFMMKFLNQINISKILHQIQTDAYSLKDIMIYLVYIIKIFTEIVFNQDQVVMVLDHIFQEVNAFLNLNSDKWWAVPQSEVTVIHQFLEVYYQVKKNNLWAENLDNMIKLCRKIVEKGYSLKILKIIISTIHSHILNQSEEERLVYFWEIINNLKDRDYLFLIVTENILMFEKIILGLCHQNRFNQCLSILQEYSEVINLKTFHRSRCMFLNIFHTFIIHLPQDKLVDIFINKLDNYNLKKIGQRPDLGFIFLFIFKEKQLLLDQKVKLRYIKLISFGMSKIQQRYLKFAEINGYLFNLFRALLKFKSFRTLQLNLKREARISHSQKVFSKLLAKKQKQCCKIKAQKKFEPLKACLLEKNHRNFKNINF